jgi:hydroxymethylpyrimidine pyrophosphatase-like HAD family hydrolase
MKLSILVLDFDGTTAIDGAFDAHVRDAICEAQTAAVVVVLDKGRMVSDLHHVLGSLCRPVCGGASVAGLRNPRRRSACVSLAFNRQTPRSPAAP